MVISVKYRGMPLIFSTFEPNFNSPLKSFEHKV